jgi:hypothetical protein
MTGKEHGNGWLWPSQVRPYITLHHTYLDIKKNSLFIGQNRGQYFIHRLGVKWYLSFSCTIYHHTEFARMYVCRQYHGYVHLPTRQELQEPNHPKDVIGSHHGISVDSLLVQPI